MAEKDEGEENKDEKDKGNQNRRIKEAEWWNSSWEIAYLLS